MNRRVTVLWEDLSAVDLQDGSEWRSVVSRGVIRSPTHWRPWKGLVRPHLCSWPWEWLRRETEGSFRWQSWLGLAEMEEGVVTRQKDQGKFLDTGNEYLEGLGSDHEDPENSNISCRGRSRVYLLTSWVQGAICLGMCKKQISFPGPKPELEIEM